jgi:uncharacterized membrane protein YeiH
MAFPEWLGWFDYAGVFVFAITGALVGARGGHDIITLLFFAAITGTGGGALRDLLIGAPVFWVANPSYLVVCLLASVCVWFGGRWLEGHRALLWLDCVGLAAYSVIGAAKAHALGVAPGACIVMGVLSATFGGVLRDVIAGQPSILLGREIYVSASLAGASAYVAAHAAGVPEPAALFAGFLMGVTVRGGAIVFGWSWPSYPAGLNPNRK